MWLAPQETSMILWSFVILRPDGYGIYLYPLKDNSRFSFFPQAKRKEFGYPITISYGLGSNKSFTFWPFILLFKNLILIMFSLMEERELHNPEIKYRYLFLNLVVNFETSSLNSIYLVKNHLESEVNKLLNTKYD